MPKNPMYLDVVYLKNGGIIKTEGDSSIIEVSSTGVASIKANIQDALASSKIYVGNASGVAAEVSVSGDGSLSNAGVLTVTGASGAFNVATNQTFTKS